MHSSNLHLAAFLGQPYFSHELQDSPLLLISSPFTGQSHKLIYKAAPQIASGQTTHKKLCVGHSHRIDNYIKGY